jgi:phospholipid/cholesterol/gamma-HCH transport system substrate-binding protein
MKHSREIKVGILALICAGILFFGFNFLKGVNIFSPTDCYYGYFERSNGLTEQAPVYILGHKVGLVESVQYDFTRTPAFVVGVHINDDIVLPVGSKMVLTADGLLGGAAIELVLADATSTDVHVEGDTLSSCIMPGLVDNLQNGLLAQLDSILTQTNMLISNLNTETGEGSLHAILQNVEQITTDLKVSGKDIRLLTHQQLPSLVTKLDTTLANVQNIVSDVNDANIQNTINSLNQTIVVFNELLQSEEGTLGLLLNNPELYNNLNSTLQLLDRALLNVDSVVVSIKERPFIKKNLSTKD